MSRFSTIVVGILALGCCAGAYYAWSNSKSAGKEASAAAGNSRPVLVTTVQVRRHDFPVKLAANGTVTALNTVDIRPQVTSTVSKVHIKEGQFVRAGELLFSLDSRADEVNVAKAQAQLDRDVATLLDNQRQLERNKDLLAKKFIAQSVVDSSQAQVDAQKALVASDKAAVNAAKVALSYDSITATAAGRSGIISVYPGSLVQPTPTSLPLVTITQMDPIAVTFTLPQRNLNDALTSMQRSDSYVLAVLPDNGGEFKGKLSFVDNVVDASSGTIRAKAVFDNKDLKLWPGAFINIELSVQTVKDAIVVPQEAIILGANDSSVYVVGADGKAALRKVLVLQSAGTEAVVSGVEAGAKVVLEGKQNLRPGVPVQEKVEAPAPATQMAPAQPAAASGQAKPASTSASAT
jgi:RND family efflux transporter MFP subunit